MKRFNLFSFIEKYEKSFVSLVIISLLSFGFICLGIFMIKQDLLVLTFFWILLLIFSAFVFLTASSTLFQKLLLYTFENHIKQFKANSFRYTIFATLNLSLLLIFGDEGTKTILYDRPYLWVIGYVCLAFLGVSLKFDKQNQSKSAFPKLALAFAIIISVVAIAMLLFLALLDLNGIFRLIGNVPKLLGIF